MKKTRFLGILSSTALLVGCGNDPITGEKGTVFGDVSIETQRSALTVTDVQPFAASVAWTSSAFTGARGTFFADVTGGGTADAIAVNDSNILVRRSNGAPPLLAPQTWFTGTFFGSVGTFFADVTGGGTADAIAVNSGNILVRTSNGSSFGGSQTWLSSGFSGTAGTFFADVNADGRADAIAVNGANVLVRLSTGSAFGVSQSWLSSGFSGTVGTFVADVTGDSRADLVAVNGGNISVCRSTGTGFSSSETWLSVGFSGSRATFVRDVTGDGLADVVAVNATDIRMRRSSRWYFGTTETMSTSSTSSTASKRLADLSGDGRADYVEVPSSSSIQVRKRQDREIPLRIVQFVNSCGQARTDTEIQAAIGDANNVFRDAGIKFKAQPVSSNPDCSGNPSSHVVISSVLSAVTSSTPALATELAKANPFNSSCNLGYSDIADLGINQQIWWVAARCAQPGEALAYIADVGTNAANNAGDGNLILYDRNIPFNLANGHFAHELGHYLGLDHTFAGGYNIIGYMDPETGQGQRLASRWDLVASGTQFFNSKAEATAFEPSLRGLEVGNTGWFCPSGDPVNKPCPFGTLPGGNPPPATLGMPIAGSATQRVYTYLPESTTFDVRMQGLSPRMPNNLPGINTMSYSYPPSDPANLKRGVSLSQIEVIQSNLNKELLTKYLDANGRVVFGNRTLLGITGVAPAVSFMSVGPATARNAVGSIASNSFNTWMVSTSALNGDGFNVYEYDGRLRQWNARNAGAYQVALPSGGANQPWAITGGVPGPVKRWNGSTFANLPGDPQAQACAQSLAVGNHVSGGYAWSTSCFGPNFEGNFKIQRYSDPTGWQFTSGPGEGWGVQVAVDWEGVPWARTILSGGAITLFKAVMDASGTITSWLQVPPPSGVTPAYLTGGAASAGTRLPVNFIGTDGRIYILNKSALTWTDAGQAPFSVAAAGGGMPYLWLVDAATGAISYAR
jgi:hypothetical protein